MFGYIQPYNPELKVKEYEAYKSVYCGLCDQLGKSFKKIIRLTLSYDFTFLAMVYYGEKTSDLVLEKTHCSVNPFARVNTFAGSSGIEYAADAAMIMIYYKLQDNILDSTLIKSLGWKLVARFVKKDKNKAAERQPQLEEIVQKMMIMQQDVENQKTDNIDYASDPTATALASIMDDIYKEPNSWRMGYLLGRYIYLCDALEDLKKDIKKGNYNPFVNKYINNTKDEKEIENALSKARDTLFMTVGELSKISTEMSFNLFSPIIHNTMELGLYNCVIGIYKKEVGVTDESI